MAYKVIRSFTTEENQFIDECCNKKIDYSKLQKIIDDGMDVNAYEENDYPNEGVIREYLVQECLMNMTTESKDFLTFLKFMDSNGLNFSLCANHLLSNLHFTYENIVEVAKYILSKVKPEELDEELSLSGIGCEESYLNCCIKDHKTANILSTAYEMIEKFIKGGQDYNKYFEYTKVIGKKITDINIYCNNMKIDNLKRFISEDIDMFIECDGERLCVVNKYIFVNNNDIYTTYNKYENHDERFNEKGFVQNIREYAIGETIEDIIFKDYPIINASCSTIHATIINIRLSNNKQIEIGCDETSNFMKVTIL